IKRESITVFFVTTALFNTLVDLNIGCFTGIRKILFGGEKVSVEHSRKAREYLGKDRIIHVYGPTETTVYATYYFIDDIAETAGTIPIGKPISNTTIYILDKNMKPVPIGVYGEIYIGGTGTARGYLNRPELTAEKFMSAPASSSSSSWGLRLAAYGCRLYKTGDLARWLPDGNIEFIGRTDLQVKIRGFRIELGEIETYLLKHNAIDEVTVIDRETERGEKYLCAYMVLKSGLEAVAPGVSELREYLSRYLPEYMIPSHFVILERLPLTPNGKVDRKALPEPETSLTEEKYVPPGNEIEERLTETWADVLGLEKVGVNHNFFEIGGDSIKAIQVASQLKKHQLQLEIKDLLMNPTIRQLSPYVKLLTRVAPQDVVEGEVELTPIQRWFFKTNFTHSHHFNQSVILYRQEGFNKDIVKKVFTRIVEHHDALRMVYEFNHGEEIVMQRNRGLSGKLYDLEVIDLKAVEEVKKRLEEIEKESGRIQGSINLRSGPLVKLGLFTTPAGDYLLIVIHHLVVDGVSWRILLEDFARGYQEAERGEPIKFPIKTDSFQHWARQLNIYTREMEEQEFLKQMNYWQRIEDAEVDSIPVDNQAPPDKRRHEYCESLYLNLSSKETQELLTTVNAAYNTEINDILLTALGLAMKEWGSTQRLLVNLEGHGREDILPRIDISRTVGWFTTQFPVILDMEGDRELSYRIKIVKETLRKIPNKGIGYGIIKYLLPLEQKKKTGLEFKLTPEINFNYLGQVNQETRYGYREVFKFADVKMGEPISPGKEQNFTLDIGAIVTGETLSIFIIYNKYEFTTDRMEKLAAALKRNLVKIIAHCLQKKEKELTPSDLDYPQLSLERWEELKNRLGEHKQSIQNIYKLAPLQEGMLFHSLFERKTGTYFEQNELTVKGEIKESLFEKSFNLLIERYDILRTIFIHEGLDEPLQVVLKQRVFKLHREDISHLPEDEKGYYLEAFKQAEREKGFDLSNDLLMKISLFKTGEDTYKIIWSFHHIIMDGWCLGIIFQDLIEIYRELKADKPVSLESPTPYRNFIKWLERFDKKEALRVWSEYLEGYEQPAHLPGSGKSALTDDYRLVEHWFSLDEGLTDELLGIARHHSVTFNTLVQTLWGILLQKYNNCGDVVFGNVVSGRPP
ncbi:MAG: AMP-binding protein, partial [Candidatus Aminicenantes bacterium]|nr:AMP-binding protein [Candidatus Aminicenantes bacterium]NIM83196.1 AMP-binding protein [Candidatus Aminicenantes bacterium]NIN22575.1 AMP-binding protein [Candidatus Aminicenantes bacterium]NIN46344.1 AMP-binding protein [Candidatus Aminicenantes bacterium]NIN89185.1 AMP-binding protein [Candidatus Aminicenantes bacterium]